MNRQNIFNDRRGQLGRVISSYVVLWYIVLIMLIFVVLVAAPSWLGKDVPVVNSFARISIIKPEVMSSGAGVGEDLLFKTVEVDWSEISKAGRYSNALKKEGAEKKMIIDYLFEVSKYEDLNPIFEVLLKDSKPGTCAYVVFGDIAGETRTTGISRGLLAEKTSRTGTEGYSVVFDGGDAICYAYSDLIGTSSLRKENLRWSSNRGIIKSYYGRCLSCDELNIKDKKTIGTKK